MERIQPYFLNKELPPVPKFAPEPVSSAPPIPPYNPLRFSRPLLSGLRTEDIAISSRLSSISSEDSLPEVPPLSHSRNGKPQKTLRVLGQPTLTINTPTYGQTDKVRQLTGYDLGLPADRRHHRKSSKDSASTTSSCYSDPEIHLLRDPEEINGSRGYMGLRQSAEMDSLYIPNKPRSLKSPKAKTRASKRYSRANLDDFLQRQCAVFQHDTLSPTSSLVHSPDYSKAQSLYSIPPTPPPPDAPNSTKFALPLRIRSAQSNEEPASRFSDVSTPPASPTTRFSAGIRDSVLAITTHAPFGRGARPVSQLFEKRGERTTDEDMFNVEISSGSGEELMMSGGLRNPMRRKWNEFGEMIDDSGKRFRGGGLMRRISDAVFTKRSAHATRNERNSGSGLGIVIPDHRRKVGGPDTPMPVLANGKAWVEGVLSREASMRRRQSVRGAIGKATESRWVVGGDERRERRRERLKGQIKVIKLQEVQEDEPM
ncbi:hypothetical protein V494_03680 [Pseudogymnoascus sp. VKM F-4513 (FW-928)]|nr:hypothetical protein V494_03680 [Pseudogymnoascus sp. VKM F-4513 (FW-928)]